MKGQTVITENALDGKRISRCAAMPRRGVLLCKRFMCSAVAMLVASLAFATDYSGYNQINVTDNHRTFITNNVKFVSSTASVANYPIAIQPMYWLDCKDSSSWTVGADDVVTKIPSKSASNRYLTANANEIIATNYGQYELWYRKKANGKLRAPVLTDSDGTLKGPYLDFGQVYEDKKAVLFFDTDVPAVVDDERRFERIELMIDIAAVLCHIL